MKNPLISTDEFYEISGDRNVVLLDCSMRANKAGLLSKFKPIKIRGARYFDLKNEFSDPDAVFPNTLPHPNRFQFYCRKLGINESSKIILYDKLGVYSSPRVWWMFKVMGHDEVQVLNGGLPEWIRRKFPTQEEYSSAGEEGDFKSVFQKNRIADLSFIKENLDNKHVLVIDARSHNRFNSLEPEPRKNLRSGKIPNSINIPFDKVLQEGKFKEPEELNLVFKDIQEPSKKLVFSCGSGITACIVYLASALLLENEKLLYDGSWTEWGTLEND